MLFIKGVPLEKVIPHMQESGKRELVWYGVTIGQIGFGVLVSQVRHLTQRPADLRQRRSPKVKKVGGASR